MADTPTLLTGLIPLAQQLEFFHQAGVDLRIQAHATGDQALQALVAKEADVASLAETAFVLRLFDQPDLRVLSVIGGCDNEVRILARRDAGIQTLADLRGKRVATQQRLSTHFFLDQVLLKYGINPEEITTIFQKLPRLPDMIVSKEVDAIVTRDPYLSQALERLGENGLLLEAPGLYDKVYVLAVRRESLIHRAEELQQLLTALLRAEHYARDHAATAQALLATLLPEENLALHWHHTRLRLWLDHRFLLTLEEVAEWAIRKQLVAGKSVPNFQGNLAPEILRRIRPIAVNLME
ncbi:MAG: ABC transporter substrate-binding protein [Magnetococcales bacterium]|nr:ABC transporter substrate-binding protein [Magnetococcales bacterium]